MGRNDKPPERTIDFAWDRPDVVISTAANMEGVRLYRDAEAWTRDRLDPVSRRSGFEPCSVEGNLVAGGGRPTVRPLDKELIWTEFALEAPKDRDVLRLARRYGLMHDSLGSERHDAFVADYGDKPGPRVCEPLDDWKRELRALYVAKEIFLGLTEGDLFRCRRALPRSRDPMFLDADFQDLYLSSFGLTDFGEDGEPSTDAADVEQRLDLTDEKDLTALLSVLLRPRIRHAEVVLESPAKSVKAKPGEVA